jgi:hypothetical protein
MKKNFVLAGFILLTVLVATLAQGAAPAERLRISGVRTRDHIYAEISLEFPKSWEIKDFQVRVDGKGVNARLASVGSTEDRQTASLLFFPGRPGVKQVAVTATVAGKTVGASQSMQWDGRPFAVLLDYPGDRLLVTDNRKIRLVAANVDNVSIKLNGELMQPETAGRDPALLSIEPAWRSGLNTVSVEGKGADGSTLRRSYTFFYPLQGIGVGQTALLAFGSVATRSGPFYSVKVEGDAVLAGASRMSSDVWVVDHEGWIGKKTRLVQELKAVKPGRVKVLIFEKPHFLQPERLLKEIRLIAAPAGT